MHFSAIKFVQTVQQKAALSGRLFSCIYYPFFALGVPYTKKGHSLSKRVSVNYFKMTVHPILSVIDDTLDQPPDYAGGFSFHTQKS